MSCWRVAVVFLVLGAAQNSFILGDQLQNNLIDDLLFLENNAFPLENELFPVENKFNIRKRMAECVGAEPEIIPEGSEQFGIRLKPLRSKSSSLLEPAASTYRGSPYQPSVYNLPPAQTSISNNVNPSTYTQQQPTTKNPYSISNYKATTPKYSPISPDPDVEAEPAGSNDVLDVLASTKGPEYLPPYDNGQASNPNLVFNPLPSSTIKAPLALPSTRTPNYPPPNEAASNLNLINTLFTEQKPVFYQSSFPIQKSFVPKPSTINPFFNFQYITTPKPSPLKIADLKNYLPPENAAPSNENLRFIEPSTIITSTTTPQPVIQSDEYLPPENPQSSDNNPTILKPNKNYQTLEELCKDPSRSYLCIPIKPKNKDKFKNGNIKKVETPQSLLNIGENTFLQPKTIPPVPISTANQPLLPESSFQDISKTKLPEEKNTPDCNDKQPVLGAASFNQISKAIFPEQSYLPPAITTEKPDFLQTTTAPKKFSTGLYAKNPFNELIFANPSDSQFKQISTTPKPQTFAPFFFVPQANSLNQPQIFPQPSNNQFQFAPRQFPTTSKPLISHEDCDKNDHKTVAASSVSENLQNYNPQPSASESVTTGYSYPQPSPTLKVYKQSSNPQSSASESVATGYSYPQPSPSFNQVKQLSNPQPAFPAFSPIIRYQNPIPIFQQQLQLPTSSISYEKELISSTPQPITPAVFSIPTTTSSPLGFYQFEISSNAQPFAPLKQINYAPPASFDTITSVPSSTFAPGLTELDKPNFNDVASVQQVLETFESQQPLGYNYPPPKNDTPISAPTDSNSGYFYPSPESKPQPAPAESSSLEGYSYPKPADNRPFVETTQKPTTGYSYPIPPINVRLNLPSNI